MGISSWNGQIKINPKEEYSEKISKHKDIFEDRSPTQEFYNRIDRIIENAPTPEEKAEIHRDKAEEHRKKAQKYQEKAERKQAKQTLRNKRSKLEEITEKISEVEEEGIKQQDEIEEDILEKYRNRDRFEGYSDEEIKEEVGFDRMVEKKLDKQPNLQELEENKQRLKQEISELENQLN